jgi:HK97 gp10 family phage protein
VSIATTVVYNRYRELKGQRQAQARRVALRTVRRIQARAFKLAPVSRPPRPPTYYHGNLADSLIDPGHPQHVFESEREGMMIRFGTSTFYAAAQEYGTVHHPAQPFLTPASEAEWPSYLASMRRIYEQAGTVGGFALELDT